MTAVIILLGLLAVLSALVLYRRATAGDAVTPPVNLSVTSPAFEEGGAIPRKYTGRGENVSPPLRLGEPDPQAKSICVIMDDVDHPAGVFNHWVIWNIPATIREIPEALPRTTRVPSLGDAVQGRSAYGGKHYYRGPKPPFGTHAYVFKVYVLDTYLALGEYARKEDVQRAADGHILRYGTITGTFGGRR